MDKRREQECRCEPPPPREQRRASDVVLWVMLTVLFPYHAICKPIFVFQKRACLGRTDVKEHEGKLSPGQRAALLCDVVIGKATALWFLSPVLRSQLIPGSVTNGVIQELKMPLLP